MDSDRRKRGSPDNKKPNLGSPHILPRHLRRAALSPRTAASRPATTDKYYMKTLIASITVLLGITLDLPAAILAGPITNAANNHVYYSLRAKTWQNAELEAVSLGGHLATIRNTNEQEFVYTNFASIGGTNRLLWIGLNDLAVKGTYQWVSAEDSTYRNFAVGEPNNANGGEYVVGIWPPASGSETGKWNDFTTATLGFGVFEIIPGIASQVSIYTAVEVGWTTQPTNKYQIQWSSSLNPNNWYNLGNPIQGTGGTNYYFDSTRVVGTKFYRVLTLDP
jgi:hypothetical protein